MTFDGSVLVAGGTSGIGRALAEHYAAAGHDVVISGRSAERARDIAGEIGTNVEGIGMDLAEPETLSEALAGLRAVSRLALTAIERDQNSTRSLQIAGARRLVTLKLVGYVEVVHQLSDRFTEDASILIFGGQAKQSPYPGSTIVTTVNAGVTGLVQTLAAELKPVRVNSIHPGIVEDSPAWAAQGEEILARHRAPTPTGRLARLSDVVEASVFLLENPSVNAVDLVVDGGRLGR